MTGLTVKHVATEQTPEVGTGCVRYRYSLERSGAPARLTMDFLNVVRSLPEVQFAYDGRGVLEVYVGADVMPSKVLEGTRLDPRQGDDVAQAVGRFLAWWTGGEFVE